jgi:NAD(P)-dependent dehydrogenase (short-subunit alcohol dehydrogenase family)
VRDGKVVVTGGSMGIGRAVAQALARRGRRVLLIARRAEPLEQARADLPGDGHEAQAMDVTDENAWTALEERLTEVDGLVCAAAVLDPVGPVGSYSPTDFRRTLDVNVVGTLLAVHHCLSSLRARRGSIVTFSGGGGTRPLRRYDAYATSKAAVVRLSENLAEELRDAGVRVNCVAPGFVATEIHRATLDAGPEVVGAEYFERTIRDLERGGVPAGETAELACMLLEREPMAPFTGKLISAQWDAWRDDEFQTRLAAEPDLATLRRIDNMLFASVPAFERTRG